MKNLTTPQSQEKCFGLLLVNEPAKLKTLHLPCGCYMLRHTSGREAKGLAQFRSQAFRGVVSDLKSAAPLGPVERKGTNDHNTAGSHSFFEN